MPISVPGDHSPAGFLVELDGTYHRLPLKQLVFFLELYAAHIQGLPLLNSKAFSFQEACDPDDSARHTVDRLRRNLGPELILTVHKGYQLTPGAGEVLVDKAIFECPLMDQRILEALRKADSGRQHHQLADV